MISAKEAIEKTIDSYEFRRNKFYEITESDIMDTALKWANSYTFSSFYTTRRKNYSC